MEVVGSKKKVVCRQSASLIVRLRVFPVLPPSASPLPMHLFPPLPQQKQKIFSFVHGNQLFATGTFPKFAYGGAEAPRSRRTLREPMY